MSKYFAHTLQHAKRTAAFRLGQLLNEFGMLMGSFPSLRDAFDPDGLPLEFILKRDSHTEPVGERPGPIPRPVTATSRGMAAHAAGQRAGQRKQISDE